MSIFDRHLKAPVRDHASRVRGAARFAMLPELEPAECATEADKARSREDRTLRIEFSKDAIQEEPTDFRDREESHDPMARLTVYAMNAAILLFAFPIGFGLLIFNILGGENLRTTAHAMALTGMVMALGMSEYAPSLPGI
ncbi:MAG: hypothetical protein AAFQ39_08260 [Pseudomonadota bacterium]